MRMAISELVEHSPVPILKSLPRHEPRPVFWDGGSGARVKISSRGLVVLGEVAIGHSLRKYRTA
jgi:hypothetical protein